nr:MAG TPA: hypothetical protein [Bacteriophage sp.]
MWRGTMFYCGDRKGFLELFNPFPIYRVNCKSNFSIRLRGKSGDGSVRPRVKITYNYSYYRFESYY